VGDQCSPAAGDAQVDDIVEAGVKYVKTNFLPLRGACPEFCV
jgi:hypothetical protein